jgi:hypothetical protein
MTKRAWLFDIKVIVDGFHMSIGYFHTVGVSGITLGSSPHIKGFLGISWTEACTAFR